MSETKLCAQCGSSSFKKEGEHSYKCDYCGAITEEKNEVNPFAAFGNFGNISTINTSTKIIVNGKEVSMDDLPEEQKEKIKKAMNIANNLNKD